jgi:hypothetical protein
MNNFDHIFQFLGVFNYGPLAKRKQRVDPEQVQKAGGNFEDKIHL